MLIISVRYYKPGYFFNKHISFSPVKVSMDNQVLFDGACNLCNAAVMFISRHDKWGKFRVESLQSHSDRELIRKYGLRKGNMHTIIYIEGKKHYLRSSAVLHILKDIGGPWKLFYVLIIIPPFIRDFFYSIIAKTRYRIFGRRDQCKLP